MREQAKTDGTYERLFEAQGGHCALCPTAPRPGRRLHIDHDHKTMEVRGLLCWRCNHQLRYWMRPDWLRRAADYLEGSWQQPSAK